VRVKVRAVVPLRGGVVIATERRRGQEHLTLPGGRPERGETLEEAVVREVREETGLCVVVGPLLYVAEVVAGATVQELNLVFRADVAQEGERPAHVLRNEDGGIERDAVMPPLLDTVFADLATGWKDCPRFLGNIHVPRRTRP
jgi:8-oxo-dGTP pyrophosphatase MutT (NUDIX family)